MDHLLIMDSDSSTASASATPTAAAAAATPPPAGKVRCCVCGKQMSSLTHDFHSFCIDCRGK